MARKKYEVESVALPAPGYESLALDELLEDGWEPFTGFDGTMREFDPVGEGHCDSPCHWIYLRRKIRHLKHEDE